jgi:pimeloyl-[acyl-carrier protein] methyl ester esterase
LKLVLLPGMDGTGELFANLLVALGGRFDTQVVSYPTKSCLSYSELECIVGEVVPTNEPFVLVAESFSTPLAIRYATSHRQNLKGLILCAGFIISPLQGWRRCFPMFLAPVLFRGRPPEIMIRRMLVGSNADPRLIEEVRAALSRVGPEVMENRLREVTTCDVRAELGEIQMPILYIQAKHDRLVLASSLKEIRKLNSNVEWAVVDGPHLLFQKEPRESAEIIVPFVERFL